MNPSDTYWLVHNAASGPAQHEHLSKESAIIEAERLAALNPGKHFHVLESIGTAHVAPIFKPHGPAAAFEEPPF